MSDSDKIEVWIGTAGVVPREGCDVLSADRGAYTNFLTLARDEEEYRAKLTGALNYYGLELISLEGVEPLSLRIDPAEEILTIARELGHDNNPQHIRFATFHTFRRVM